MHLNVAMFEQSANCGYNLKPAAMWDVAHPHFGKFAPADAPALVLQLTIISGRLRDKGRPLLVANKMNIAMLEKRCQVD